MDKFVIISLVVTVLCAVLVLFRIEARQKRTSVLKPSSYKFGLLGMVVYLVVYALLTLVEKLCFGVGRIRLSTRDNIVYDPKFYWHPWNTFCEDYSNHDNED